MTDILIAQPYEDLFNAAEVENEMFLALERAGMELFDELGYRVHRDLDPVLDNPMNISIEELPGETLEFDTVRQRCTWD